jgi:tetratricopeptide (TPR) repeat protein
MKSEQIDWNQDVVGTYQDKYQALVRSLRRRRGFGLLFVECSPAQGARIIENVKIDLPQKKIEVWDLQQPIEKFFNLVEDLHKTKPVNILFVQGLEYSFYEYENQQRQRGWDSEEIYTQSWRGVPAILNHLNQQRERFRDRFNICFVFLLPRFAVDYFIRRAPDFFDWRSGFFKFPMDAESLRQESQKVCWERWQEEHYLALTTQERRQKIVEIQSLIDEDRQTPEQKASLFFEKGLLHKTAGELEAAIAAYDQALKFKPDLNEAWYNRGLALFDLGRLKEAIAAYDQALKFKPDYHEAWINRGVALRNLGRFEEAIAAYDQAVKFKPDDHYAWNNRGVALGDLGRLEEAIASFDQAIKFKPDKHEAWNNRGLALGNLGRLEEEIASYDQALKFKPDLHEAWYNRGLALGNLGRLEEEIASYDQAVKFKPDKHEAWNNRGLALLNLGRLEEAIAAYDQALKFKPDEPNTWYNKACTYALHGNIDLAIKSLQQAINLNPEEYREMAKTDSDFDKIRADERFQALIQVHSMK